MSDILLTLYELFVEFMWIIAYVSSVGLLVGAFKFVIWPDLNEEQS